MAGSDGTAVNPATGDYDQAIVALGRLLADETVDSSSDVTALTAEVDELQLDDTVVALTPGIAVAYDAALGHVATLAMSTDATQTITISNLAAGESCTVVATQNAAGSKALVFASTFFAGGTEPTMTAAASAVDIYTVINIGGQLYGFVAGQDMKT
jgi:hypothetical protein